MASPRRKAARTRTHVLADYLDTTLVPDLRARAHDPAVHAVLTARWEHERMHRRTGAALPEWIDQTVTQVGVAWVLSAVFVRVLEDRGLVPQRRLAGGDAPESERLFYELFPSLGARDYVMSVFTEVSHAPVVGALLGPAGNPAWRLPPSHEAIRALLALLRDGDAQGTLTLRFDDRDTRFLGDLYQDLSADVRERYALLQTPDFVERFILDRTLEPALAEFGLEGVRMIDPTCGSGHFLLGAFARLYDRHAAAKPGAAPEALAASALAQVYGSDVNPYAVAIARLRLLLAYVDRCAITKIADAPALPMLMANVVVADSLLRGAAVTRELADLVPADQRAAWGPPHFDFADHPAADAVFARGYEVVVGNPPYITCKDAALREVYRAGYPDSASGKFALAAPFTERFFTLASPRGYVGLINANSFMKREFGKGLIEKVLRRLDLTTVVDTSGAYIPGHGTPTVILCGRRQPPQGATVRVAMGRRGEPETPADPAQGKVWRSITEHLDAACYEDEFVTVADVSRETLAKHPWSMGGGGAGELKELIEARCATTLGDCADSIGVDTITRASELLELDRQTFLRLSVEEEVLLDYVSGEEVRDWAVVPGCTIPVPHDRSTWKELATIDHLPGLKRFLWPHRDWLKHRWVSGGTRLSDVGKPYWIVPQLPADKHLAPLSITLAFVATHNHFVLDRGGKVFKQSAPIIKLKVGWAEDDCLALLAWLNSSAVCFWIKQISHDKGSGTDTGKWQAESAKIAFEFSGGAVEKIPVPTMTTPLRERLLPIATALDRHARDRSSLVADALPSLSDARPISSAAEVRAIFAESHERNDVIVAAQVTLQEEIDWIAYHQLGLCADLSAASAGLDPLLLSGTSLGARPFEMLLARNGQTKGIDGQPLIASPPKSWSTAQRALWERRVEAITTTALLQVVEVPDYKRRWLVTPKDLAGRVWTFDDEVQRHVQTWLRDRVESAVRRVCNEQLATLQDIDEVLRGDVTFQAVLEFSQGVEGTDSVRALLDLLVEESVPYLAAQRHTDDGLAKRARWEHTWSLQRREDAGESVGEIPVPPKYDREDYRDARYWSLRGKLDVPRERFIAYPGAELDAKSPVFGWAGWDHLQRARALAALYQQRKQHDGWDRDRLRPMLAGLLELLPWLLQWHNEPDPELDGLRQGQVWAEFLEGERVALGWSEDELRAWRPAAPTRATAKKPAGRGKKAAKTDDPA